MYILRKDWAYQEILWDALWAQSSTGEAEERTLASTKIEERRGETKTQQEDEQDEGKAPQREEDQEESQQEASVERGLRQG